MAFVVPHIVVAIVILKCRCSSQLEGNCCDTGQNDTIGKIELNPSFVLSHKSANSKNDIQ